MRRYGLATAVLVAGLSSALAGPAPLAPPSDGAPLVTLAASCGYGLYRGIDGASHRRGFVHAQSHPGKNQHCFWHGGAQICN
jgi:hypothetical protein